MATPFSLDVAGATADEQADNVSEPELTVAETSTTEPEPEPVKKPSILDRIAPVGIASPWIKALIYSDNGVGKTVLAAGAPHCLIIDCEGGRGATSLLNHPGLRNTPVFPVEDFNDMADLFWEFKQDNLPWCKTIVIDNFQELQATGLGQQVAKAAAKDNSHHPLVPNLHDYKVNKEIFRQLIIDYLCLPVNIIVTTGRESDKDEETGALYWRPAVTPSVANTIKALFDLVGYMTAKTDGKGQITHRYLQINPSENITAKTRIGGLPGIIEDPTFDIIWKAHLSRLPESVRKEVTGE